MLHAIDKFEFLWTCVLRVRHMPHLCDKKPNFLGLVVSDDAHTSPVVNKYDVIRTCDYYGKAHPSPLLTDLNLFWTCSLDEAHASSLMTKLNLFELVVFKVRHMPHSFVWLYWF